MWRCREKENKFVFSGGGGGVLDAAVMHWRKSKKTVKLKECPLQSRIYQFQLAKREWIKTGVTKLKPGFQFDFGRHKAKRGRKMWGRCFKLSRKKE